jgi:cysteinyl-tRNA synthetase
MTIHIYNTLSRKKEPFTPVEKGKVNMYVCGPTVYNHIHIGNARPALFFDVVRRFLEYTGHEVMFIQNFTDIDDKIIKTAQEQGASAQDISETYIGAYYDVAERLGIRKADMHPKVTENIHSIVLFIEELIAAGFAYEAGGDVFFRTDRFEEYGKLSHQNTQELREGVRIEIGEHKEAAIDFTLWKKAKPGETSWDSPWGKGRPGWHIECSTLIRKYFGETIDIHGGGIDLSFPHHENEIAQTESLTKKPLANYWMHVAMLTINDQKMSKSLGNFITTQEVLQHHDSQVIRFFMLSGHYRTPLNYSEETLIQSANALERLKTTAANLAHRLPKTAAEQGKKEPLPAVRKFEEAFVQAMNDDFNTANAVSVLFDLVKEANQALQNEETPALLLQQYYDTLLALADILGFALSPAEQTDGLSAARIEELIAERNTARKQKQFDKADAIRDQLLAQGIVLEDTRQGVRWRRK